MATTTQRQNIGGWLILIAIAIVIITVKIFIAIFTGYLPMLFSTDWALLFASESQFYNPLFGFFLVLEFLVNSALLFAWLYMNYTFFTKKAIFPKIYIIITLVSLISVFVDSYIVHIFIPYKEVFSDDNLRELLYAAIMFFVGGAYMLFSTRVDKTFRK